MAAFLIVFLKRNMNFVMTRFMTRNEFQKWKFYCFMTNS